jgi:hypothetical protein
MTFELIFSKCSAPIKFGLDKVTRSSQRWKQALGKDARSGATPLQISF